MARMAAKPGRGGRREGAGRPAKPGLTPLKVRITLALKARLARSAAKAKQTMQDHVAEILERGLGTK